jgi:hypothetical protein
MAVRKHIDNLIHPPGQDHQKESPVLRLVARDPDVV